MKRRSVHDAWTMERGVLVRRRGASGLRLAAAIQLPVAAGAVTISEFGRLDETHCDSNQLRPKCHSEQDLPAYAAGPGREA